MATKKIYRPFVRLYTKYDKEVFASKLPKYAFVFNDSEKYDIVFKPKKWEDSRDEDKPLIHEICLNPNFFYQEDIKCHFRLRKIGKTMI